MTKHAASAHRPLAAETTPLELDGGLAELRGDCARMAPHWQSPAPAAERAVPPAALRGVMVPPASAKLLDGMSEYGD